MVARAFDEEHEKTYSYRAEAGYQILNLRVIGRQAEDWTVPSRLTSPVALKVRDRRAFFGPQHGWATVPVITRSDLSADEMKGPVIVEEYDSTTIVPPRWSVATDENANIVLTA
jgi:N-methylhydantoinase A